MSARHVYPTREGESARWRTLFRAMNARAAFITDADVAPAPERPGRLLVLGSGIGTLGFTRDAEQHIVAADKVFYCVADAATEVWLRRLRPDAYDLYVFYSDSKRRYFTYVQMAEAILHHVREGLTVAVVFYGHPGVFVLPTHRAIAIARREGHRAEMKPGVSALDCLCADLGVDPAYPGLQTFEATDMLLRQRPIDIGSHLVLWQVGLIGLLGFRRRGFINAHFQYLVDYLDSYYGPDFTLTHYIASRYPTLPPVIERYEVSELADPVVQTRFTGISTFYLPPKQGRAVDRAFAEQVGILKPSGRLHPPRPLRTIDQYGPREMQALDQLAEFEVPEDYHFQEETGAADFLIRLAGDAELRATYETDPNQAVSEEQFPALTPRERFLLSSRQSSRIQLAARGAAVSWSPMEHFLLDLLSQPSLIAAFNAVLKEYAPQSNGYQQVDAWLQGQGFSGASILDYGSAMAAVQASSLMAWTGIYLTSDPQPLFLAVFGNLASNAASVVMYNATRIIKPTFANGVLSWAVSDGNPNAGEITFSPPAAGDKAFLRKAVGSVAYEGQSTTFNGVEELPPDNPLGVWIGEYKTQVSSDGSNWQDGPILVVAPPTVDAPAPSVTVDGAAVAGFSFTGSTLSWDGGQSQVTFVASTATPGANTLTGQLSGHPQVKAASTTAYTASYQGEYATRTLQNGAWKPFLPLYYDGTTLQIGRIQIADATLTNRQLQWCGAGGAYDNGDIQFTVSPLSNQIVFQGMIWPANTTKPVTSNFNGAWAPQFLLNWVGTYNTSLGATSPTLAIQGGAPPAPVSVLYNGGAIPYTFQGDTLAGSLTSGDSYSATFTYKVNDKTIDRAFAGSVVSAGKSQAWTSLSLSNDMTKWSGQYSTTLTAADGSQVMGPTLSVVATGAETYSVTVTPMGGADVPVATPAYTEGNTLLSWVNDPGFPNASTFANAALSFSDDATNEYKQFAGSAWAVGSSPPAKANWSGHTVPAPQPGPGFPWWGWLLIGGGALGLGGILYGAYLWRSRSAARFTEGTVEEGVELLQCKKKQEMFDPGALRGALAPALSLGDGCEEEEEDFDEEEDEFEGEDENAFETDPEGFDMGNGTEPFPDDPDVQVDTETDTDADVEADIDSETEVDTDIDITADELFFDEDFETADRMNPDFVSGEDEVD